MDVPQELLTNFDVGVDAMLRSDMAPTCVLVYPPQKDECPNCIVNPMSGESSGINLVDLVLLKVVRFVLGVRDLVLLILNQMVLLSC